MSNEPSTGYSQRIGVPSEARFAMQRQIKNEEVSRRYSTMLPIQNIRAEGQFLQKVSGRHWSGRAIVAVWLLVGLPLLGMLAAGIPNAHGTPAHRLWNLVAACSFPGIPLFALAALTRNWLRRRRT